MSVKEKGPCRVKGAVGVWMNVLREEDCVGGKRCRIKLSGAEERGRSRRQDCVWGERHGNRDRWRCPVG